MLRFRMKVKAKNMEASSPYSIAFFIVVPHFRQNAFYCLYTTKMGKTQE